MAVEGQLGFKTETTWGTAVTVDKFHPGWMSGNPTVDQAPLVSKGMRTGRRLPHCVKPGFRKVAGSFGLELFPIPMATLLRHMGGTIATTGAGPYEHTMSLGTLTNKSMTMQFSVPGTDGTSRAFTLAGAKLASWSLKATAGEIATLDLGVTAKDYVTATALASASYPAACPLTFIEASFSVDGSPIGETKSVEIARTVPLRDTPYLGSATVLQQVETGMSSVQVNAEVEFRDLTIHDLANTSVDAVLLFDNGDDSLEITTSVFVTPTTPQHPGGDGLPSFNFTGIAAGTTDAGAFSAVLTNTESSSA